MNILTNFFSIEVSFTPFIQIVAFYVPKPGAGPNWWFCYFFNKYLLSAIRDVCEIFKIIYLKFLYEYGISM